MPCPYQTWPNSAVRNCTVWRPHEHLRSANPKLKGTNRPAAGTRLVIPTVAIPSALAMQAVGAHRPHATASRTHRVRRGETLTAIARRYRVSLPALCRANAIHRDNTLRAGMRLRIPG